MFGNQTLLCQVVLSVRSCVAAIRPEDLSPAVSPQVGRLESEETAMPGHFCHMEAPHKKLRLPEWYVSSLMMDRALDAVVRRVKNLDRGHETSPILLATAGTARRSTLTAICRHRSATAAATSTLIAFSFCTRRSRRP